MFILGEFVEKFLFGYSLAIFFFCAEVLGDGVEGHDRGMVDAVFLYLAGDFQSGGKCLGYIGEQGVHLAAGLQPFLLGVDHAVLIAEIVVGSQADKAVVCLGIGFIDEVGVVGGHEFYIVFFCECYYMWLDFHLAFVYVATCAHGRGLVPLEFEVIVIAECFFPPGHTFVGGFVVACLQQSGYFATKTCRTYDKSLAVSCKRSFIGAWMVVEAFGPCLRHEFDEILIAGEIFCQYDKVTSFVGFIATIGKGVVGHVHLAAYYRL